MNIKKWLVAGIIISLSLSGALQANPFGVYPFESPKEYAEKLENYRNTWTRVTGFEHSGLHWQQFVVVFINKDADVYEHNYNEYLRYYQDYDEDEDEDEITPPNFRSYSAGTIILKENFASEKGIPDNALTVTLMIKHEAGYDPSNGDWEYVQYSKNGNVIIAGNSQDPVVKEACASCHLNIADRDYVFANIFSKRLNKK